MDIVVSTSAQKALRQLPRRDAEALWAKLVAYARDPEAAADVKPLRNMGGKRRLRHGDWRAIVIIEGDSIVVETVKHRREAYR